MINEDKLKEFAFSNLLIESELNKIEDRYSIKLNSDHQENDQEIDEDFYPQFSIDLRKEAEEMASHYQIFYCLERSIRNIIQDKLESEHGINWWDSCIQDDIKNNVESNMKRELDSGITLRSNFEIDYTTFGELTQIVTKNWDSFSDVFNSQRAFIKIMSSLNTLRSPIAHCCELAPDEVVRLQLTVKDWFRLME